MPRSSREKTEETHTRIVDSAYHLFITNGYHATSMRAISQYAGLTVGAIYNHFPNKEELWMDVMLVKHPYRNIFPLIQAAPASSIAQLLRFAAGTIVQQLSNHPDLLNLMLIEVVEFNGKHVPAFFDAIFPEALKLRSLLMGKQDRLRDIPVSVIVRSFVGLFFSYYITGVLLNEHPGITIDPKSLDQFVDLYLYGILAEDDPSRAAVSQPGRSFADLLIPGPQEEA